MRKCTTQGTLPFVEAFPGVKGLPGRARNRPGKLYADRAYNHEHVELGCAGCSMRQ